jgi:hypothetical protein
MSQTASAEPYQVTVCSWPLTDSVCSAASTVTDHAECLGSSPIAEVEKKTRGPVACVALRR